MSAALPPRVIPALTAPVVCVVAVGPPFGAGSPRRRPERQRGHYGTGGSARSSPSQTGHDLPIPLDGPELARGQSFRTETGEEAKGDTW